MGRRGTIDRPLTEADRQAPRALSTRARITATGFTSAHEWGDFKGDPVRRMENWFDLHLYLANWGSRRLMIRLPKRLVDRRLLDAFLGQVDWAELRVVGEKLILDIDRDELEFEDCDDGSGWLAAPAPLRAEVLAGDLRLFNLLWLTAVGDDVFEVDESEPTPGIGPMTGPLEAFVEFFGIDLDLVRAAAVKTLNPSTSIGVLVRNPRWPRLRGAAAPARQLAVRYRNGHRPVISRTWPSAIARH